MSIDAWVEIIVGTIVTFSCTFGAAHWQVRVAREIANPNQKNTKPKRQFIDSKAKIFLKSFWPFFVSIFSASSLLIRESTKDQSLTRVSVLIIALLVGGIFFNLGLMVLFFTLDEMHAARMEVITKSKSDMPS